MTERAPVARWPAPPTTVESIAVARLSKPDNTVDDTPLATLLWPAPTNAFCATAALNVPAATALPVPLATLLPAVNPIHELGPLPGPSLGEIDCTVDGAYTAVVAGAKSPTSTT